MRNLNVWAVCSLGVNNTHLSNAFDTLHVGVKDDVTVSMFEYFKSTIDFIQNSFQKHRQHDGGKSFNE